MRRVLLFFIVVVIFINASACAVDKKQDNSTEEPVAPTGAQLIDSADPVESLSNELDGFSAFGGNIDYVLADKGEFYELYQQKHGTAVYFRIWDVNANTLDFAYYEKDGRFSQTGDLLEFSMTCGTSCRWAKYYDAKGSRISRFFNNPLDTNEELVVYTDLINDVHCFVVQNIFDPTVYYKVIEMDPKPNSAVQFTATFIDSMHIQVTYPTADGEFSQVYTIDDLT